MAPQTALKQCHGYREASRAHPTTLILQLCHDIFGLLLLHLLLSGATTRHGAFFKRDHEMTLLGPYRTAQHSQRARERPGPSAQKA